MRTACCWALGFALAVVSGAVGAQANAACAEYDKLREHGKTHFSQIKGAPVMEGMSQRVATFKLPGAHECVIEIDDPKHSRYTCTWFVARETAGGPEAVKVFESMARSITRCSPVPESLERGKRSSGEWASVLDKFPGQRANQLRFFEASYRYRNHWWSVSLEYEVNDDYTN